jgi:two-component system chemotaxis sensor kinase CheA
MIDKEILHDYAAEARELLDEMDQSLIRLEKEGGEPELLNNIFRAAHCIKGSAEYIGLERSGKLTHGVENLLDRLREGVIELRPGIVDFLFRAKDLIHALLEEVMEAQEEKTDISPMMDELNRLLTSGAPEFGIPSVRAARWEDYPEEEPGEIPGAVPAADTEAGLEAETTEDTDAFLETFETLVETEAPTVDFGTRDQYPDFETSQLTDEITEGARSDVEFSSSTDELLAAAAGAPSPTVEKKPAVYPEIEPLPEELIEPSPLEELEAGGTLDETIPHVLNLSLYVDDLEDGLSLDARRGPMLGTIGNLRESMEFMGMRHAVAVLENMEDLMVSLKDARGGVPADELRKLRSLLEDLQNFYPPDTFPREEPTLPEPEVTPTEEVSPVPASILAGLEKIPGVDRSLLLGLQAAGFTSRDQLALTNVDTLLQVRGMTRLTAEAILQAVQTVPEPVKKKLPVRKAGARSLMADIDEELLREFEEVSPETGPLELPPPVVTRPEARRPKTLDLAQQLGVVAEETDREIIDIFLSYAWEIVDKIKPVVAKINNRSVAKSDLESCAESIKAIRASASYMDYQKLAFLLEDWYKRTLWVAERLDSIAPGELNFVEEKLGDFQGFLRGLEAALKPQPPAAKMPPLAKPVPEAPPVRPAPRAPEAPVAMGARVAPAAAAPKARPAAGPPMAVRPPAAPTPHKTERPPAEQQAEERAGAVDGDTALESPIVRTMRVEASKVDILLNQVGELVVNRSYVEQLSLELKNILRDLSAAREVGKKEIQGLKDITLRVGEASLSLGRAATDLQEGVMKLRMLPVGQLFGRMPRLIRDLSRRVGKSVTLEVMGGDTEVDKRVIEQIYNPLVHLIRNAVDHGIEDAKIRSAQGKPEEGTIRLSAYSQGNMVVIDVEDDGAGINEEEVVDEAVKRGLIDPREIPDLAPQEIYGFLFVPGFSTSKKVTRTSGRGVGMDVVKRDVEKINGQIEIESKKGKGTKVSIRIPLTLAIIQTLLIRFGTHIFAIPLTSVREIIQTAPLEISTIEGFEVIKFRNETIPILRMNEVFRMNRFLPSGQTKYLVLASIGLKTVGFPVEELVGEQDVVIKPLAEHVWKTRGLAGSTILGDGTIALVLDVAELVDDIIFRQRQLALAATRESQGQVRENLSEIT